MLTYSDVAPLAKELPIIGCINNLPQGPFDRIVASIKKCGADIRLFNLTQKIKVQSYFDASLPRIIPTSGGKEYLYKMTVKQKIFLKSHTDICNDYEYQYCSESLNVPLREEKELQKCELIFLGDHGMIIDADKLATTLASRPALQWCSSANTYTGFCMYPAGCVKWQGTGCADCPALGKTVDGKDRCSEVFRRKQTGLQAVSGLTVVTPSRWLGREIQESLLGGRFARTVIPTDVRLDIYRPRPRSEVRKALGMPDDRPVLLTGSAGMRKNKGAHLLCEALRQLQGTWEGQPPRVLFFGTDAPLLSQVQSYGLEAQSLGWVDDLRTLAEIYAAADLFVNPAFQDNLPNTVNEALSCGTPVICFDRFSSEDVVIDGVTGFLAAHPGLPLSLDGQLVQRAPYEPESEQCNSLADTIRKFFALPAWRREAMGWECRRLAEATFNPALVAGRYLQVFRHMAGLSHIPLP